MKSIGQVLRAAREKKKLNVEDVHKFVKIHPSFLRALENDNYSLFESKVHAKGFLKIYAGFLDLNVPEIIALWRREYEKYFEQSKASIPIQMENITKDRLVLSPGLLATLILGVLIMLFFGYLFYQYRTYTGDPVLEIISPEDNLLTQSDTLDVLGHTDLDCKIFINQQEVLLNQGGSFAVTLKLKDGINTLNFVSLNKLGKRTEETRTVVYRNIVKPTVPLPEDDSDVTQESTPSNPEVAGTISE